MATQKILQIRVTDLAVDLTNPRHAPVAGQRDAIAAIALAHGVKLANLAEDILDKGLNLSELPIVTPESVDAAENGDTPKKGGVYTVLDGNRRIAAIKLLSSPQLLASVGLPKKLEDRFKALAKDAGAALPTMVYCAVVPREDSKHWVLLKHTGQNLGVGVVPWDGVARQRFRGSSAALQAIELVAKSNLLDKETKDKLPKISITNVERLLFTPEARKALGVEVKNNHLTLISPEDQALGRLAIVVSAVANKEVKVSDLDSKEQRVSYAQKVAEMPLQTLGGKQGTTGKPGGGTAGGGSGRRVGLDRRALIPSSVKFAIPQPRINRIYSELQKLEVAKFVNCCAVTFRVFIELSMDHYAEQNDISLVNSWNGKTGELHTKEMTFKEKVTLLANHLEKSGVCDKHQLQGAKTLANAKDEAWSVDGLNGYVHNKDYNPDHDQLKRHWDNIQPFVEGLWTVRK